MADGSNEVITEIREDAAIDGANRVAEVAAVGDQIISSQVSAVEATLDAHQEQSEERHEQILENQQWLENQFQLLSSNQTTMNNQLSALAATQAAATAAITQLLESTNQRLTDFQQSMQPPQSTQEPTPTPAAPEVNPQSDGAVDQPEAPTPPKKRNRVI